MNIKATKNEYLDVEVSEEQIREAVLVLLIKKMPPQYWCYEWFEIKEGHFYGCFEASAGSHSYVVRDNLIVIHHPIEIDENLEQLIKTHIFISKTF